jgi:DNA-binding response OmpR family regulator
MRPRILIVEDEFLLAMHIAHHLETAGFDVLGPAVSATKALAILRDAACDAATLDVHLGPEQTSEHVAHELRARGIPFVTVTGYLDEQRPQAFDGAPVLSKPVRPAALIAALRRCLSGD